MQIKIKDVCYGRMTKVNSQFILSVHEALKIPRLSSGAIISIKSILTKTINNDNKPKSK